MSTYMECPDEDYNLEKDKHKLKEDEEASSVGSGSSGNESEAEDPDEIGSDMEQAGSKKKKPSSGEKEEKKCDKKEKKDRKKDADIEKDLQLAFKMLMSEIPRWEDLGKPDIDDGDKCDRRSDEWKLASNVAARKRGEKVIYSWTNRKS